MSEVRDELQVQADKLKELRAGLGLTRKAFSEYKEETERRALDEQE